MARHVSIAGAVAAARQVPVPRVKLPQAADAVALKIPEVIPAEHLVQRIVDVSTDIIQAVASAAETKTNKLARARAFFVSGMEIDVVERVNQYKKNASDMVLNSEITPEQLSVMRFLFQTIQSNVHDAYVLQMAAAWASYVAQSRLGTTYRGQRKRHVSNVKDYFGKKNATGRVLGTSKEHTAGVLRVEMKVQPAGTKPRLQRHRTQIVGMNSELLHAVLEGAQHRLNNVWLPKEIHVFTDFGHAIIVLNERNEVGDVVDWPEVQRKVGLESGQRFWQVWGKDVALS